MSAAINTGLNEISSRAATFGISTASSSLLKRVRQWSGRALHARQAKDPTGMDGG